MSKVLQHVRARPLNISMPNWRNNFAQKGGGHLHKTSSTSSSNLHVPVVLEMEDSSTVASSTGNELDQKSINHKSALQEKRPTKMSGLFSSFKRFCRRAYKKLGLKHCISMAVIILYTIFGAIIFLTLERSNDVQRLKSSYEQYSEKRRTFVNNLGAEMIPVVSLSQARRIIDARLRQYEEDIGYSIQTETYWDIWHAMYYAGTIYTTIGYGDIYCRTTAGRLITIIYSLIGIPLVLSVLTDLGSLLLKMLFNATRLYNNCISYVFHSKTTLEDPKKKKITKNNETNENVLETIEDAATEDTVTMDLEDIEKRDEDQYEYHLMRVPVLTALSATIGWIFFCAGLFCIWEDWNYFTSIYFFFISLSTVGLGDETPTRKDIMVATYALVIVGLALVSMCITVIQRRLEDLYLQLLRMILQEYHKQLRQGGDQLGATMGIMNIWKHNKAAKFLMPLLSKDKKQTVSQKFQDEAKARGFAIPAILRDLDPKTGVPAILKVASDKGIENQNDLREAVGDAIRHAADKARILHEPADNVALEIMYSNMAGAPPVPTPPPPAPPPIAYDADTQTERLEVDEKQAQTITVKLIDSQTQSEAFENAKIDNASQTDAVISNEAGIQYEQFEDEGPAEAVTVPKHEQAIQTEMIPIAEASMQTQEIQKSCRDDEMQTETSTTSEAFAQTPQVSYKEQLIQTHVYELHNVRVQTDTVQTKNQRLQTPVPETLDEESQTDAVGVEPNQQGPFQWGKAKTNLHDIIKKAMGMHKSSSKPKLGLSNDQEPAMASWSEVGESNDHYASEEEEEDWVPDEPGGQETKDKRPGASKRVRGNLRWDPVDGLHAEKQRRVSDLKDLFDHQQRQQMKASSSGGFDFGLSFQKQPK